MNKTFKFDTVLALVILFLLIFGLIMITSIGVPKSIALSAPDVLYPSCSDSNVDCYLLFKKHLFRLGFGLMVFYIAYRLPIKFWKRVSPLVFAGTTLMLLMVFVMGQSYGTIATSWITVANTSLQPSEFAKLAMIIYLAYWFTKKGSAVASFEDGFIPFCVISGILLLPVVLQNDFGSALVLGLIGVSMFFAAGARVKHLAVGFTAAMLVAIVIIATVPHVQQRFKSFTSIDENCLQDDCWQSLQANIAVGSGGLWGRGLTQGVQKSYWLPQASDDFIFAASAEELGFFRIVFVVLAYFMIALRGYSIASRAQNNYEMLLATGITTWLTMQAFINIAVNTALMPVTGITLPFVSYGGSSLVSSLIGVAILLHISKSTTHHANSFHRRGERRSRYPQRRRYRRA